MNRKSFIRDIALAIAINLVPKVLQPINSEVMSEEICANDYEGTDWGGITYGFKSFTVDTYILRFKNYKQFNK